MHLLERIFPTFSDPNLRLKNHISLLHDNLDRIFDVVSLNKRLAKPYSFGIAYFNH
jgi:hypothetical protein